MQTAARRVDNDGITDSADLCSGTPSGESVDANGCSSSQLDSDNDGVSDADDLCPNTPEGEQVNASGCSASTCSVGTNWDGESCVPIVCPFGLTLVGDVCVDPNPGGGGSGGSNVSNNQLIPVTSILPTALSCNASTTVLQMAGFEVAFSGLCGFSTLLDEVPENSLLAALPTDNEFVGGINITLLQDGTPVSELPSGTSMSLSFDLPEGVSGESLAILYWDQTANGGAGDWVEQSFSIEDGKIVALIDMPGTYVLIDKSIVVSQENNFSSILVDFFKDVFRAFSGGTN